jgi:hypothetical protein
MRWGRMRHASTAMILPLPSRSGTIRNAIGTAAKRCFSVGGTKTAFPPAAFTTPSATVATRRSPTRSSAIRATTRPTGSATK